MSDLEYEPLYGKNDTIVGMIATIPKPEHDRKYIIVWKPDDIWYGKVRFSNASLTMPEAKLNFLREKFDLDSRLRAEYQRIKEQ